MDYYGWLFIPPWTWYGKGQKWNIFKGKLSIFFPCTLLTLRADLGEMCGLQKLCFLFYFFFSVVTFDGFAFKINGKIFTHGHCDKNCVMDIIIQSKRIKWTKHRERLQLIQTRAYHTIIIIVIISDDYEDYRWMKSQHTDDTWFISARVIFLVWKWWCCDYQYD